MMAFEGVILSSASEMIPLTLQIQGNGSSQFFFEIDSINFEEIVREYKKLT